ncbi:MAG: precorrin-2 dehydrogenase/sirohydrochlorin ferrochelatase family protein [Desulfobulbales bacterium]
MSFYPICLDLEGRNCVVVGGGKVAERKVQGLLDCSAVVSVISPDLTDELLRLHNDNVIHWVARRYRKGDLERAFLVIAATDDVATQEEVFEEAVAANLLLNVADVPQRCNFILPATVRRGDLAIAISTAGKSPALARKLRMELEKRFGVEYRVLVDILGVLRPAILASGLPQSDKEKLFKQLLHDDIAAWIWGKDWPRIEHHFGQALGDKVGSDWLQKIRPLFNYEEK